MSSNTSHRDASPSQSPRSASTSLQAAATLNAGLQRGEPVRRSSSSSLSQRARQSSSNGRRRSQVLMNLQIADPATPGPGEMIDHHHGAATAGGYRATSPQPIPGSPCLVSPNDPRHSRAPSLGEIHQELENEQEFQVNRLLQEIRRLQVQVQRQQSGQSDEAVSDRAVPLPIQTSGVSVSFDMARADLQRWSRTPSRGASPRLRATSISGESGDQFALGGRDESTFYQAETQMLVRENQMLRHRIRELAERQLSEANGSNSSITHEPMQASHLNHSTSVAEDDSRPTPSGGTSLPTVADASKEE
ncbi:hypothetical protein GQ53DRAFT_890625 [Thozetella sp. PMI_491]|nr:hypothetical protein GQ53DRAFT_890625 [Thozetella sp. PMI_491]